MKFITASLLAAIFAVTITSARAQEGAALPLQHGSYFVLEGGWNAMEPTNALNGLSLSTNRIKTKQGWALSTAGGYKFENGLRTEIEASYHRNNYRNLYTSFFNNPVSGRQVTGSVMANVLYDIKTGTRVTPYFGGGVGASMVWIKHLTYLITGTGSPVTTFLNDDSAKVAFQGIVGMAIAVAPQFEIVMDARYRVSNGHTFRVPNVAGTYNSYSKYNVHEVTAMAGLRYAF